MLSSGKVRGSLSEQARPTRERERELPSASRAKHRARGRSAASARKSANFNRSLPYTGGANRGEAVHSQPDLGVKRGFALFVGPGRRPRGGPARARGSSTAARCIAARPAAAPGHPRQQCDHRWFGGLRRSRGRQVVWSRKYSAARSPKPVAHVARLLLLPPLGHRSLASHAA
eukprot:scaffold26215_cov107-Isochrysis_galbana.AAC.9